MGDMNFPDPNTTTEHDGWDWDGEKWIKRGSSGVTTYTLPVSLRSGGAQLPLTVDGAKLAVMTRGGELELPLAA
jgi:hypothetical protein